MSREKNVSVIVPVYRVEEYLPQCLDSLLSALEDTDELLLSVRDGGDRSCEIAGEYAQRHQNIRIVTQDGHGLADARNCAMRLARGDYLLFVDGDDRVYPEKLRRLLDAVRDGSWDADVVMTDYYVESGTQPRLLRQIGNRTLRGLDALPSVICRTSAFWTVWRNVYSRSFLEQNELSFGNSEFNEDADFIARLLTARPDMLFVDMPFYCYRQDRTGSLMNERTFTRMQENEKIFRASIARLRSEDCAWGRAAVTGYQYGYVMNIALLRELPREERKRGATLFARWREALYPSSDRGVRAFSLLMRTAGVKAAAEILHRLKLRKRKREGRAM